MTEASLERAREELVRHDLIAYEKPLYQVLSLAETLPLSPRRESEPTLIRELFRELAGGLSAENNASSPDGGCT